MRVTPRPAALVWGANRIDRWAYFCQQDRASDRTYRTEQDRIAPDMTNGEWLSLGEAARRLGTTPDAVRQRIRRNKILARRGNDGRPRVYLEFSHTAQTELEASAGPVIPNRTESGITGRDSDPLIAELRRQLAEQQARHDAETARQLAERDRLHQEHVERMQAQAATERALMLERIDAAELRAERVEARLDQILDALMVERRSRWRWWQS